jgi:hypothetical protein
MFGPGRTATRRVPTVSDKLTTAEMIEHIVTGTYRAMGLEPNAHEIREAALAAAGEFDAHYKRTGTVPGIRIDRVDGRLVAAVVLP